MKGSTFPYHVKREDHNFFMSGGGQGFLPPFSEAVYIFFQWICILFLLTLCAINYILFNIYDIKSILSQFN